jgi:hypothetical protein
VAPGSPPAPRPVTTASTSGLLQCFWCHAASDSTFIAQLPADPVSRCHALPRCVAVDRNGLPGLRRSHPYLASAELIEDVAGPNDEDSVAAQGITLLDPRITM